MQLAIEMALRKVHINLPNASNEAIDNFCYRYWKHHFVYSANQIGTGKESSPRDLVATPECWTDLLFINLAFGEPLLFTPGQHFATIQTALTKYAILYAILHWTSLTVH